MPRFNKVLLIEEPSLPTPKNKSAFDTEPRIPGAFVKLLIASSKSVSKSIPDIITSLLAIPVVK